MSDTSDHARTGIGSVAGSITGQLAESISEKVAEIKPKLRGWLHLAAAPMVLAAGVVLIALSPTERAAVGAIVYTAAALLQTAHASFTSALQAIALAGVVMVAGAAWLVARMLRGVDLSAAPQH